MTFQETGKSDHFLREKPVNKGWTWDYPVMEFLEKDLKAPVISVNTLEMNGSIVLWKNRNHVKEWNGNFRTKKYSIWNTNLCLGSVADIKIHQ